MHSFDLQGNILIVKSGGAFSEDEAKLFMSEYQQKVKSINPSNTTLIIDATELKVLAQDLMPLLENCMGLYMQAGFKNVFMLDFASAITNSQIKRIAKSVGFDQNYKMFPTLQEALNAAKA